MATRRTERLTALQVKRATAPGSLPDGNGLYLQVGPNGSKSWIFRFKIQGRTRWMGLGPAHTVSLAEAREKARDQRRLLLAGVDPIEARDAEEKRLLLEAARSRTFAECVTAYIDAHRDKWKNAKHADQWKSTLETHANPTIGHLPVAAVDTGLVTQVLEKIWKTTPETASRLRGRIEKILDWARVRGYREGENPARWRGHLEALLPARSTVRVVKHHPALPYSQLGSFMATLRTQEGDAAIALQLLILCALRTNEVIGARWTEFNLDEALWVIPKERMKIKKNDHRVPLSPQALAILTKRYDERSSEYVFPGRGHSHMSNMAMLALLQRMGRRDIVPHGFRSTFRDWASEITNYPREVAEAALAHAIADKVEAAYRRGDLFNKRRSMMEAWANFCDTPSDAKVITAGFGGSKKTAA